MCLQPRRHRARRRRRCAQPAGFRRGLDQRAGRSRATGCRSARPRAGPTGARRLLCTRWQDLPHPRSRAKTGRRRGGRPGSQAAGAGAGKPRTPETERRTDCRRRPRHSGVVGRQAVPAHPAGRAMFGHRCDSSSPGYQTDPPTRRHRRAGAAAGRVARCHVENPGGRRHPAVRHLFHAADREHRGHRSLPRPHAGCS
ncbi:hypothetical protein D3C75_770620 [compost metagenome]